MNYKDLIDQNLLKEETINFPQVHKVLAKAANDLKSSQILFANEQFENAYELAYESMLFAGRALVFSFGLRPRAQGAHKITIEFVQRVLGDKNDLLIKKLDKARKKRHYLIYGSGLEVSEIEVRNAIENARQLIKIITEFIERKNPQMKMF